MGYGRKYPLTIKYPDKEKNEIGEWEKVYKEKGTVKGKVWQLNGDESYISNKDSRVINYKSSFDKPDFEITEEDRLYYNDKDFDIEVVNDLDLRGIKLELDLKLVK